MKRKFKNLKQNASLKNIGEKNSAVVPYGSRTVGTKIESQEEFPFEISSASKALYYFKQQNDELKAEDLYSDGSEPEPSDKVTITIDNFESDINLYVEQDKEIVATIEAGQAVEVELFVEIGTYFTIPDGTQDIHKVSFEGTYRGVTYNKDLEIYGRGDIVNPEGDADWHFDELDRGTLTIKMKEPPAPKNHIIIDNTNGSEGQYIEITRENIGTSIIHAGEVDDIDFTVYPGRYIKFEIKYEDGSTVIKDRCHFEGKYLEEVYDDYLRIAEYTYIGDPLNNWVSWYPQINDYGKITITEKPEAQNCLYDNEGNIVTTEFGRLCYENDSPVPPTPPTPPQPVNTLIIDNTDCEDSVKIYYETPEYEVIDIATVQPGETFNLNFLEYTTSESGFYIDYVSNSYPATFEGKYGGNLISDVSLNIEEDPDFGHMYICSPDGGSWDNLQDGDYGTIKTNHSI